jgi:hypothetical protein
MYVYMVNEPKFHLIAKNQKKPKKPPWSQGKEPRGREMSK